MKLIARILLSYLLCTTLSVLGQPGLLEEAITDLHAKQHVSALAKLEQVLSQQLSAELQAQAYYYQGLTYIDIAEQRLMGLQVEATHSTPYLAGYRSLKQAGKLAMPKWSQLANERLSQITPFLLQEGLVIFNAAHRPEASPQVLQDKQSLIDHFNAVIDLDSTNYIAYDLSGQLKLEAGDTLMALADFDHALLYFEQYPPQQPDPLVAYIYYRAARVIFYANSDPRTALSYLSNGLAQLESDLQRMQSQAVLYTPAKQQQFQQHYQQAKRDLTAFQVQLRSQQSQLQPNEMLQLQSAVEADPQNYALRVNYAHVLEKVDVQQAIYQFQTAIRIDSTRFEAPFNLGALYFNQGVKRFREANLAAAVAARQDLQQKGVQFFEQALPYLQHAHRIQSQHIPTLDALIQVTHQLHLVDQHEQYQAARRLLE